MPNKNYVKGRKKEYRLCKELRGLGCVIVQRTAGSHSPIDIIAIDKKRKLIFLVQSKPDGYSSHKYDQFNWLNSKFDVMFKVM
jgi:Holliday junction resolvase